MAHQSFSKTVLDKLSELAEAGNGEVHVTDLSDALMIQTTQKHKRMLNALSDLKKAGRIDRVRQAVYTRTPRTQEPDKREVMWRVLRMRKAVTIADLEELAGVSKFYAKEYLELLDRRGIVKRVVPPNPNHPHSWRMVRADAEMPIDNDKAERYRKIRLQKKEEALADLAEAKKLIGKACRVIKDIE